MRPATIAAYAGLALAAAGADQFVKRLVTESMELHERIDVMPFLSLFYTHNTGIAFSFLSGFNDTAMVVLASIVMVFICWMAVRTEPHQGAARLGFALILGGALGNVIDRSMHGHVVDYVLVHTESWAFAVFNLADAFITVGAGLVILQELIDWRRGRNQTNAG